MKKIAVLALCFTIVFCACGLGYSENSLDAEQLTAISAPVSSPTNTPDVCDGLGMLGWGDGYDKLFASVEHIEIVQHNAEYAGFYGSIFYRFDKEGELEYGYYVFYESSELSGAEIFVEVRNYLLETYGQTEKLTSPNYEPMPTLEEVVLTGEGSYLELWYAKNSDGQRVAIQLRYADNSRQLMSNSHVTLEFINPANSRR